MSSEAGKPVALLQGSLDLILLRALQTMGPQHSYGLAKRLEQVSDAPFSLAQGTLYPALVRLEQKGWIRGVWQNTDKGRPAKFYGITKAGARALRDETARWRRLMGLIEKLLLDEPQP
jgi:PadR family transcriptional regulator, regulatory protein PadR